MSSAVHVGKIPALPGRRVLRERTTVERDHTTKLEGSNGDSIDKLQKGLTVSRKPKLNKAVRKTSGESFLRDKDLVNTPSLRKQPPKGFCIPWRWEVLKEKDSTSSRWGGGIFRSTGRGFRMRLGRVIGWGRRWGCRLPTHIMLQQAHVNYTSSLVMQMELEMWWLIKITSAKMQKLAVD